MENFWKADYMQFGQMNQPTRSFSDFIIYLDESGDHSLQKIDKNYPIFVLTFCLFQKTHYIKKVVPAFQELKFRYFGHDMVVFHEREIRKSEGDFHILSRAEIREAFHRDLNIMIQKAPIHIISSIIDKRLLSERQIHNDNPYNLALKNCLHLAHSFMSETKQDGRVTHLVCESRGRKEDKDLELAFRRICPGLDLFSELPFDIVFADKKVNSVGLQLADLTARPIGRHHLNEAEPNRAYKVLQQKFTITENGFVDGSGRGIFMR
jgi:hypothetical protein